MSMSYANHAKAQLVKSAANLNFGWIYLIEKSIFTRWACRFEFIAKVRNNYSEICYNNCYLKKMWLYKNFKH